MFKSHKLSLCFEMMRIWSEAALHQNYLWSLGNTDMPGTATDLLWQDLQGWGRWAGLLCDLPDIYISLGSKTLRNNWERRIWLSDKQKDSDTAFLSVSFIYTNMKSYAEVSDTCLVSLLVQRTYLSCESVYTDEMPRSFCRNTLKKKKSHVQIVMLLLLKNPWELELIVKIQTPKIGIQSPPFFCVCIHAENKSQYLHIRIIHKQLKNARRVIPYGITPWASDLKVSQYC